MDKEYDVVIVGAGPAGLFAAYELCNKSKLRVAVIDEGRDIDKRNCFIEEVNYCTKCTPCNIMKGVGGAGGLSDGTLNLRPDIGGNLTELTHDEKYSWQLVWEADEIFVKHGANKNLHKGKEEKIKAWELKAAQHGVKFIPIIQRHIGSDYTKSVIKSIKDYLINKGVEFLLLTKVLEFDEGKVTITQNSTIEVIKCKYIIVAPGRSGADWFSQIAKKIDMNTKYGPIDVGVRVEVPAIIMEPITRINHDPKFHIFTPTYDDFVRTFCTNPYGFVVKEKYDDYVGVNGHSMIDKKSDNTNFAFLVRVNLTEPVENTTRYGKSIAKLATTIGGGKPIVQRLGDLKEGRRSTPERLLKNHTKGTLKDTTAGDIAMALPHRIVTDIIEGLEKLDKVVNGIANGNTLIYAPEIKYYASKVEINENLETSKENIFVAGDGAGLTRDLINAAATGLMSARGVLIKEKLFSQKDFKKNKNFKKLIEESL